ncbi:carbonate dehydratase activity [Sparganum proliferum]
MEEEEENNQLAFLDVLLCREMHIVSYSSMYTGSSTAPSAPGGLAVIGVFFQLTTDQSNSSLSKMGDLLSLISRLRTSGSATEMRSFDPRVVLPKSKDQFFRYYGSLTTPPCTENVQWTVMRDPLYVTTADLELLRSLQFGSTDDRKPMQDNFRPVQMLNPVGAAQPRVLYKSWSAAPRPVTASVFVFLLCLALFMSSV